MNSSDFCQMLRQRGLLGDPVLQRLEQRLNNREQLDVKKTLEELVTNKLISRWQSKILAAGKPDAFQIGNYRLQDRVERGPLAGCFVARHTATRHPVLLQFVPGKSDADEFVWRSVAALAERACQLSHPSIARYFQAVSIPDYRFVVSEVPSGKPLIAIVGDKVTGGKRVAWQTACDVIRQAALGVSELHRVGIIHNALSPNSLWIDKRKSVTVRLQFLPNDSFEPTDRDAARSTLCKFDFSAPEANQGGAKIDEHSDLYSLGCVLYWMLTGEALFDGDTPATRIRQHQKVSLDLSRLGKSIPDEVAFLLKRLLAKDSQKRTSSAAVLANQLATVVGQGSTTSSQSAEAPGEKSPAGEGTLAAYEAWLEQWSMPETARGEVAQTAESADSQPPIDWSPVASSTSVGDDFIMQAALIPSQPRDRLRRRKRLSWFSQAAILLLTVGSAAASAWLIVGMGQRDPGLTGRSGVDHEAAATESLNSSLGEAAEVDAPTRNLVNGQRLIDDDGQTLWQRPTNGPPIEFNWLPPSPAMILTARVQRLLSHVEGQRMKQALGDSANEQIDSWLQQLAIDPNTIERLQVSLHLGESFRYEAFWLIDLAQPQPFETLVASLPDHDSVEAGTVFPSTISGLEILVTDTQALDSSEPADAGVRQFAIGSPELVAQAAATRGAQLLSGALLELASLSDSRHDISVLTTRLAWFNDAGKALMGEPLRSVNRQLDVAVDEMITAMQLGLHVDEATYLEFRVAHRPDIRSPAMKNIARETVSRQLGKLAEFSQANSSNYWGEVQQRIPDMMNAITENLRWDVEQKTVVANVWLPKPAAHNLLAVGELASWQMTQPVSESSVALADASKSPQNLNDLLEAKRSLVINNPPDLGVLLQQFQNEIRADYPGLPFEFTIRLSGGDLRQEGITQNQRPGSLSIENKSIAEVLTSIVVSANPDKAISGPEDPNCKLVWTVADDKNNNQQTILITTRAAAQRDGILPAVFASKSE